MKRDVYDVSSNRVLGNSINWLMLFSFESTEQTIVNNEHVSVIFVDILFVHSVMHPVMRRGIEKPFEKTQFWNYCRMLHKSKEETNGFNRQNV